MHYTYRKSRKTIILNKNTVNDKNTVNEQIKYKI